MTTNPNEVMAELLISKAQNMPDKIKKAFVRRSVEDAKQLKKFIIEGIETNGEIDLQKLSYSIYKAYTLGAALYDGDQLITNEINLQENLEKKQAQAKIEDNNKIVDFTKYRKVSN